MDETSVGLIGKLKRLLNKLTKRKWEEKLQQQGCKWVFQVQVHIPGASHMSGVWERLVKSVKRSLKAILGKDLINEEVL